MLFYRVVPYLETARVGEPGHPMFAPTPQGKGRIDNPGEYVAWYFATTPVAAIGETFGDLATWDEEMFLYPALTEARRALATYELDEGATLLNMDDANALIHLDLRPTQVVTRDRATTQAWALAAFRERQPGRVGVSWWSFHRPQWTIVGLWQPHGQGPPHRLLDVQQLSIDHESVRAAAKELARKIT